MKIAVVTGASSGIGAATARRLAGEGFFVVAAARRRERLAALVDEVGGLAVPCDVTSDADVTCLTHAVAELPGDLHLLVNNAGGALGLDEVAQADLAGWQWMYDVNVLGTVRVTKAPFADCIAWCATRPHHVNIDRLVVRPLAQAAQHKVHRVTQ